MKKKSSKTKRILKIIIGVIIFFTLPSFLFFGILYFKYNEDLPTGKQGVEADMLAQNMLNQLNYSAYKTTSYLEWTFRGKHHYQWHKANNHCIVNWDHFKVDLNFEALNKSKVFVAEQEYNGIEKQKYLDKALAYFNNDSFWIVAPFKVFDKGVERRLIKTKEGKDALLVTYTSGGSTPGDSYLWHFNEKGKPISYQMWVDILPIDGLEASWENWTLTESGIELSSFHKLLFFGLEISNIKATTNPK